MMDLSTVPLLEKHRANQQFSVCQRNSQIHDCASIDLQQQPCLSNNYPVVRQHSSWMHFNQQLGCCLFKSTIVLDRLLCVSMCDVSGFSYNSGSIDALWLKSCSSGSKFVFLEKLTMELSDPVHVCLCVIQLYMNLVLIVSL